jgi:Protein of unknown function (DUF3046)
MSVDMDDPHRRWLSTARTAMTAFIHSETGWCVGGRQLAQLGQHGWSGDRLGRLAGSLARVRLTAFWEKMRAQFGETYAESVAKDHVIAALGDRTVNQALADGEDAKVVWRAVCDAFRLPDRVR